MIPALESSTHINYDLTARFNGAYFSTVAPESAPQAPPFFADHGENLCWTEARFRNFRTVRFADCMNAYQALKPVANVEVFMQQMQVFRDFAQNGILAINSSANGDVHIRIGRCLSVIAYGQLVAENCRASEHPLALISVIFHTLIEDLSEEVLQLASMFSADSPLRIQLKSGIRIPRTDADDFESAFAFILDRYCE